MAKFKFTPGDYVKSTRGNIFLVQSRANSFIGHDNKTVQKPAYRVKNLMSGAVYDVRLPEAHGRWRPCSPAEAVLFAKQHGVTV